VKHRVHARMNGSTSCGSRGKFRSAEHLKVTCPTCRKLCGQCVAIDRHEGTEGRWRSDHTKGAERGR
jgi:hypothetical protein